MGVLIAAAAIGAVGAVASSAMAANAQKKAAAAQADAIKNQKGVDIAAVTQQAHDADLAKYQDQYKQLNQVDPATGLLRTNTNAALDNYSSNDTNANNANSILGTLTQENQPVSATDLNFYNTLRSQAQNQLDLGGQLSPEQQAEFVRSGLEGASTTGLNAGSAATRQSIGGLLASQQMALEQQRQGMAKNLFGFATDLKNNRNQALGNIATQSVNASNAEGAKLLNLSQLVDNRVPNIGLSGHDIAGLAVGNVTQANNAAAQQGAVDASNAQARGQIAAGLVGSLGSVAGTAFKAYGNQSTPSYGATNPNPTAANPNPTSQDWANYYGAPGAQPGTKPGG